MEHSEENMNARDAEREGSASGSGMVVLAATPIGNVGDASDRLKELLQRARRPARRHPRR